MESLASLKFEKIFSRANNSKCNIETEYSKSVGLVKERSSQTENSTTTRHEVGAEFGGEFKALTASVSYSFSSETTNSQIDISSEMLSTTTTFTDKLEIPAGESVYVWQLAIVYNGKKVLTNEIVLTSTDKPPAILKGDVTVQKHQTRYVKGISVSYGKIMPEGAIPEDINKGFGGSYVWISPVYTFNEKEAASHFECVISKEKEEGHVDLAKGAGGDYRYIVPRYAESRKVKGITVLRSGSKLNLQNATSDVNEGRKGDYVYLQWSY